MLWGPALVLPGLSGFWIYITMRQSRRTGLKRIHW